MTTPTPPSPDWTASIPWIVAAIVAAIGWASTHLLSEARERRKEIRAQIDKLFEQLYKLEQESRAYHCAAEFDAAKAGDLDSKIQILERTMNRVPIFQVDSLIPHIIRLRRSITYRNFDKSQFASQTLHSEILQDVFSASQEIEDEMEYQYRRRYISRFPYFSLKR